MFTLLVERKSARTLSFGPYTTKESAVKRAVQYYTNVLVTDSSNVYRTVKDLQKIIERFTEAISSNGCFMVEDDRYYICKMQD